MALRRIKKQNSRSSLFIKLLSYSFLGITILLIASILYFNGNKVKKPLEQYLTSKSGQTVTIDKVEFSALYPNTLKLYKVKTDNVHIDEIYVEYDVLAAIKSNNLIIDYLYLKKPILKDKISLKDTLKSSFNHIYADRVHIEDTSLNFSKLHSKQASIDVRQLNYTQSMDFSSVQYNLQEGNIGPLSFKTLSFNLREHGDRIFLDNLSMQTLGGSVQAQVSIEKNIITADNVIASKLILRDLPKSSDFSLHLTNGRIIDSFLQIDDSIFNNLSGNFKKISLDKDSVKGNFNGKAGSIMYRNLPPVTDSNVQFTIDKSGIDFNMEGSVIDGSINVDAHIDSYTDNPVTTINSLELNNCKFELNSDIYETLKSEFDTLKQIRLNNIRLNNVSFLSFINKLPLSVKKINATVTGVNITQNSIKGDPAGLINIESNSLLYSDLYIKRIYAITTLTDDFFTVAIPELTFRKSTLALSGDISTNKGRSYLLLHAHNFDMSEINSSLLSTLFAGRINLDIELKSSDLDNMEKLHGHALITSKDLLISDFGLDLINGGDMQNFTLSGSQLMTSLADADAGLNDFKMEAHIKNSRLNFSATSSLSSCNVTAFGRYDLKNNTSDFEGHFISPGGDSKTKLHAKFNGNSFTFDIKPEKRGQKRPGLYIKDDFKVKEPTDRPIKISTIAKANDTKKSSETHNAATETKTAELKDKDTADSNNKKEDTTVKTDNNTSYKKAQKDKSINI